MPDPRPPIPPAKYYEPAFSDSNMFLDAIANAGAAFPQNAGLTGLLSGAGALGAYGYSESKLRQLGRQALAEQAARSLGQQFQVDPRDVARASRGRKAGIDALPKEALTEINARRSGNSLFNVVTPGGRAAGKRAKALARKDFDALLAYAYGQPDESGIYPETGGPLREKVAKPMEAYEAAVEAFNKNPATAPVPGKKPKTPFVPDPNVISKAETRFGMERAAGQMAEASRPGLLTKAFKVGQSPIKAAAKGGLISGGLSILPQIGDFIAEKTIPRYRANREARIAETKKLVESAKAVQTPTRLNGTDTRNDIIKRATSGTNVFVKGKDGTLTINENATPHQIKIRLEQVESDITKNASKYDPSVVKNWLNNIARVRQRLPRPSK